MKDKIENKARFLHILDAILEIEEYTKKITFEKFQQNNMMQNACIRLLEVIGEASNHITENIREQYPEIEWREITDLRKVFPSADQVGKFTVFNIGGNKVRLITAIHYNRKLIFIRNVLTHKEYDKNYWKE